MVGGFKSDVLEHHTICSRHFRNGDTTQIPSLNLGERFISPKKPSSQRHKSSRKRKNLSLQYEPVMKQPNTSSEVTHEPAASDTTNSEVYSTPVGEALLTDYHISINIGEDYIWRLAEKMQSATS